MIKNVADLTSQDFSKGLNTIHDIFKIAKEETPDSMNVKFEFDGNMGKRLGTNTKNAAALSDTGSSGTLGVTTCGWAMFDFGAGASGIRWLLVGGGTAVWASSDMGASFVRVASDRAATYQHYERSKNVAIMTSDAYNQVLFWPGSAGTLASALAPNSAPLAKYSINFQGFLIFLNNSTNKRRFTYEDENTQITGDYADSFDIPSSADDEITGGFILSNKLYISTRYYLYQVTYQGGNPDWGYRQIKSWGFVPHTPRKISLGEVGEVVVGMDWYRRIRIFDGSQDKIISDKVENDNRMCEFALEKISYAGSGLNVSFAEMDDQDQVYKLALAIGGNTGQTTHFLCLDGRTSAFFPYDYSNIGFMSMTMAESGNRRYLVACDQSGWIHMMDSGNRDRNTYAIDDHVDSTFLFEKSPSQSGKAQKIDFYFSVNSAGRLAFQDRIDFNNTFSTPAKFFNVASGGKVQHLESFDVPSTHNSYQWRISSSSNTNEPWKLNRVDYFVSGLGIGSEVRP